MMDNPAPLPPEQLRQIGVLNLAHAGDAVYELLVRTHVIAGHAAMKLGDQHRATTAYVSAPAQAAAMRALLPALTAEEHAVYRRGRNARVHGCPPGCTIAEYHAATALEALFGWLWLSGQTRRIEELFSVITGEDHAS